MYESMKEGRRVQERGLCMVISYTGRQRRMRAGRQVTNGSRMSSAILFFSFLFFLFSLPLPSSATLGFLILVLRWGVFFGAMAMAMALAM
ncbi:uncharacterized protein P884DRAFT_254552, partial [Thermothelomyces heterothallicus CBS 202.75]|uniref:uncharacterized protein n=1 Tax=Thermothelomyces heterothallicus CBS 202.75 TaxID=1149848 RepID=UPI00374258DC